MSRKNIFYENREQMAPITPNKYSKNQDIFYGAENWRKRYGVDVNYPHEVDINNIHTKLYNDKRLSESRQMNNPDQLGSNCLITPLKENMGSTKTQPIQNISDNYGVKSWNKRYGPHKLKREQHITRQHDMSGVYNKKMVHRMYGRQDMCNGEVQNLKQLEGMY